MSVWIFWLVAAAICVGVAGILMKSMRRGDDAALSPDVAIYREQLRDVDRDLARGTLDAAEAERLRTEVSRRLLEADRAAPKGSRGRGPMAGAAAVVLALGAGVLIYRDLGAPGYADLPLAARIDAVEQMRAARPSQAEAEAQRTSDAPQPDPEFQTLMNRLREAVADNPDDLRGLRLLARNEMALGNYRAAADAQERVVALTDGDAAERAAWAEALILGAGGYVSPEAERVLTDALARNPEQPLALYYSGLMMAQGGRDDLAFRLWRNALRVAPEDAGYVPVIRQAMPQIAASAGVRWEQTAAPVGPTQEQVDAMSALPQDQRDAAIGAMVQQLSDRLANQGGTVDEWARLITAYGVLGQKDRAATIWNEARQIFTNDGELAIVRAAAAQAGVE